MLAGAWHSAQCQRFGKLHTSMAISLFMISHKQQNAGGGFGPQRYGYAPPPAALPGYRGAYTAAAPAAQPPPQAHGYRGEPQYPRGHVAAAPAATQPPQQSYVDRGVVGAFNSAQPQVETRHGSDFIQVNGQLYARAPEAVGSPWGTVNDMRAAAPQQQPHALHAGVSRFDTQRPAQQRPPPVQHAGAHGGYVPHQQAPMQQREGLPPGIQGHQRASSAHRLPPDLARQQPMHLQSPQRQRSRSGGPGGHDDRWRY